jgi:hypothetical protein
MDASSRQFIERQSGRPGDAGDALAAQAGGRPGDEDEEVDGCRR